VPAVAGLRRLLWPIAWLWAYTKPVMYKLAYGTDKVAPSTANNRSPPPNRQSRPTELQQLRARVKELETQTGRQVCRRQEARSDMEILLLGIYSFFVWLIFFKFRAAVEHYQPGHHHHHPDHRASPA
jgi:hypothetical protein